MAYAYRQLARALHPDKCLSLAEIAVNIASPLSRSQGKLGFAPSMVDIATSSLLSLPRKGNAGERRGTWGKCHKEDLQVS